MKLITANKLNRMWNRGFLPKLNLKIDKTKVLTTVEQVSANTNAENIAGATVAKELINNLMFPDGTRFYPDVHDGKRGYNTDAARGADTFVPFKRGLTFVTGSVSMKPGLKTIITVERPKFIAVFHNITDLMSYKTHGMTGVYLTDDDYNVLVYQGSYALKNVTNKSFDVNQNQDGTYPISYIYGY